MPRTNIRSSIGSVMYNRFESKSRKAALVRLPKYIFYRAVLVLQANLRFMGIGVVGMYSVGMRMQLQ